MLKIQKNKNRLICISALSILVASFAVFSVNRVAKSNSVKATSNTMSAGFVDQNFYDCIFDQYHGEHPDEAIAATGLTDGQLSTLTYISCTKNNGVISSLQGAEKLTSLRELYLSGNYDNISDSVLPDLTPLGNLTNLKILSLRNFKEVGDISIINNITSLGSLNLTESNVGNLPTLDHLNNLLELKLRISNIDDISAIAALTNLQILDLSNGESRYYNDNHIIDISPIANLVNLKSLNLSHNGVSDVTPLSGLANLQSVRLDGNAIFDFSPILDKNYSYISAQDQENTIYTNTKTVTLPKLFEQVKDSSGTDGTVAKQLYCVAPSASLHNATLNNSGENITINDIASQASIAVCGAYNGVSCGIARGSSLTIKFRSNLVGIYAPTAIAGLANGVAKTADGLELPDIITVRLENDILVDLPVAWAVDESAYDPSSAEAQTFTIDGAITLPYYITNEDNLSLVTSITVSVLAADGSDNQDQSNDSEDGIDAPDTGKNTNDNESAKTLPSLALPMLTLLIVVLMLIKKHSSKR